MKTIGSPLLDHRALEKPSFSRDELEGILMGLTKSWGSRSPDGTGPAKAFFKDLSLEELDAIARFLLN